MSVVFYFTNRCAIPTAAGRVQNVQRPHVFNDTIVYIRRMRRECCGVKLVVSYTVCPAGRP
jgi:hypothetical protein